MTGILKAQSVQFGPKAGFQVSNFTHVNDSRAALTWFAGAFGQYALPVEGLGLQGELLYSVQGINDADTDIYKERGMNIVLPLLATYELMDKLKVHAGLQPGFLIRSNLVIDDEGGRLTFDRTYKYHRFNMAFLIGAEYEVMEGLNAGLRLNAGMSDLFIGYTGQKHNSFQLYLAYTL
ncbi:MAG: PorT family protein [Saprospirales bacterium]|nr:PorT family protein [Saprospirales bacterium]